jgi:hypothetical protein
MKYCMTDVRINPNPCSARVGSVVDKVAMGQVSLLVLRFSHVCIVSPLLLIHILLIYQQRYRQS